MKNQKNGGDDLPAALCDVTAAIGLPATLTIVSIYGGVRLYVPMTPEHILAHLIGFETALKLSKEYGGPDHFDIPRAVVALRAARNNEIADKFVKGATCGNSP